MYFKYLYLRNCIVLYSVHWYMYYVHIKKLSIRAAVVANNCFSASINNRINATGVSDRWICSIIRYSRRVSPLLKL